jgi:hypothetical protein
MSSFCLDWNYWKWHSYTNIISRDIKYFLPVFSGPTDLHHVCRSGVFVEHGEGFKSVKIIRCYNKEIREVWQVF